MDLQSTFAIAARALSRNKLRSSLTMVGITIGIAAVICTVAIGQGASLAVHAQLENLGDNFVWVEAGGRNLNGVRTGNAANKSLTLADAWAIRDTIPFIKAVSPNVDGSIQVIYGNQNWYTHYRGVSPEFLSIRKWPVISGAAFTSRDDASDANVVLLGQTVVQRLFPSEDPIGKIIRISTIPFQVVGVLQPKGLAASGYDFDDTVMMPYTTVMKKIKGIDWLDDIWCSTTSASTIYPAQDQIRRLLRQRHHLRFDEPDDFNIRHPEDALQAQEAATRTFTLMLASIASVSLLVGGIGIMNIMLVSVTERTREIGVRMAVGATEAELRLQFLSEAVALSLLGGFAGVAAGVAAASALSNFLHWPTSISLTGMLLAVAFSMATGVFFGYYPARKASLLDPIEALRYE